jgi:hypothetical protein
LTTSEEEEDITPASPVKKLVVWLCVPLALTGPQNLESAEKYHWQCCGSVSGIQYFWSLDLESRMDKKSGFWILYLQ